MEHLWENVYIIRPNGNMAKGMVMDTKVPARACFVCHVLEHFPEGKISCQDGYKYPTFIRFETVTPVGPCFIMDKDAIPN